MHHTSSSQHQMAIFLSPIPKLPLLKLALPRRSLLMGSSLISASKILSFPCLSPAVLSSQHQEPFCTQGSSLASHPILDMLQMSGALPMSHARMSQIRPVVLPQLCSSNSLHQARQGSKMIAFRQQKVLHGLLIGLAISDRNWRPQLRDKRGQRCWSRAA